MKLRGATFGETLGPAMEIADQAGADDYFDQLVEHYVATAKTPRTREEAAAIVRSNLGYYAGYYSEEVQDRVNKLFKTTHPVFGDKWPTAIEAFEAGQKLAEEMKNDPMDKDQ